MPTVANAQAAQLVAILSRRADEVAAFRTRHKDLPEAVDTALSREVVRLRALKTVCLPSVPCNPNEDTGT